VAGLKCRPAVILSDYHRDLFWSWVDIGAADECWPWKLWVSNKGYGMFVSLGRTQTASRVAWFLSNGINPDGVVCHSCDNPICCNPAHLFLGTQSDNIRDCVRKGRHNEARKTHCNRGHEFSLENTGFTASRARLCRACNRERQKRKYQARKARAAA
jgi:hypothetical protein